MLTVSFLLLATAFVLTILSAIGKAPLWVPLLLIVILLLLDRVPK